ncbi:MAG: YigZ family protein [Clostridiales bacterium]|nr:YigZ family protein [Clostridiales bacterium]
MIVCVKPSIYELTIKRSRFISVSRHIDDREDVKSFIEKLKREHPDARHVCYGYIADEKGDDFGYDDDGEPSGTAGKPIYSAIAAAGARKTVIAVVRYFGGIKLGAGGLTRAYRQSAAELIEQAGLARAEKYAEYEVECDNETYKRAGAVLRNLNCKVEGIVYNKTVSFTALAPVACDLSGALSTIGVAPVKIGEKYVFEENEQ